MGLADLLAGQLIPHRVEIGTEMENVPDEDDSKKSSELVPTSPKKKCPTAAHSPCRIAVAKLDVGWKRN